MLRFNEEWFPDDDLDLHGDDGFYYHGDYEFEPPFVPNSDEDSENSSAHTDDHFPATASPEQEIAEEERKSPPAASTSLSDPADSSLQPAVNNNSREEKNTQNPVTTPSASPPQPTSQPPLWCAVAQGAKSKFNTNAAGFEPSTQTAQPPSAKPSYAAAATRLSSNPSRGAPIPQRQPQSHTNPSSSHTPPSKQPAHQTSNNRTGQVAYQRDRSSTSYQSSVPRTRPEMFRPPREEGQRGHDNHPQRPRGRANFSGRW